VVGLWAEDKAAIAAAWLARAAAAYPPQTARFLIAERDQFRNPVGAAFRRVLPVLFEELAGEMNPLRLASALDDIMHIRAVQYFTAEEAIGFVYLLHDVLARQRPDLTGALHNRIEELAQLARDEFERCQERIRVIRAREASRRTFVSGRLRSSP
jgi:hypothetical protein